MNAGEFSVRNQHVIFVAMAFVLLGSLVTYQMLERLPRGQYGCRPVRRVVCGPAGHGDEAHYGSSNRSPQDCGHCFNHLEEGRAFRSVIIEATSSVSAEESR